MSVHSRLSAFLSWLAIVGVLLLIVSRASFTADMSVFLPRSPTPEQQLLVDQLREGMVSRLTLIGLTGGDGAERSAISRRMAADLRADDRFSAINNGEAVHLEADRRWLFDNRYALSPAVNGERFTVAGLHTALQDTVRLLASPLGLVAKPLLARDPTGELMNLLGALDSAEQPRREGDVWVSQDGATTLLLAMSRASGADIDAQEDAMNAIRAAFAKAVASHGAGSAVELAMTGPGVFSVQSRATIKDEVTRIAVIGSSLIIILLLIIYRSLPVLLLGLLPVVTGTLAGIAAVSLGFGVVHGLTLGFGTTLIGEAVDYAIYLFVQQGQPKERRSQFWPTIRIGLLTSSCGFIALLASGFPGLAQLGLYSLAGLVAAALMTRYLLPAMLPTDFRLRDVSALGHRLARLVAAATRLRWMVITLALSSLALIANQRQGVWNGELLALSPVPASAQALDKRLRSELGAPDVRYLIVIDGRDTEAALQAAEALAPALNRLQDAHLIAGWDSPARYLPSQAIQRARLASLPPREALAARLQAASTGLPLRTKRLQAFVDDVDAARQRPLLDRASMAGTSLALAVDAMLLDSAHGARALLPLRAPTTGRQAGLIDADAVRAELATVALPATSPPPRFLDLKHESDALYRGYLGEAIQLSLGGVLAILVLLLVFLRRPMRVVRVALPLAASILVVVAALILAGKQLILLHLIGLLLIVAVGSNYALFFDNGNGDGAAPSPATLASLLFANLTTVAGFGLLAFSEVPVLQAIGITVGPGAILALLFSAMLSARRPLPPGG
ncbi:MMPL family transporter [Azoarcus sp. L1K30]|uniref:MMPL family transporter n=1 Tax=Azoarcus sp. L1K30 TaxID=2820277 RepID=UPI001B82829E|nr:MMPL family transporter [Azoarcus sp. L1K30]MBR0567187.1 MMPL family transporter [Azoarcus sp. L1K30]